MFYHPMDVYMQKNSITGCSAVPLRFKICPKKRLNMNIMPMLPRKSVIYLINRRTDMAFDGAFLHKTVSELKEACDSHIDKIYQPSKDELVFLLRKKDFCKRLLISVKQGSARIQFTENKYENPRCSACLCGNIFRPLN